MASLRPDPRLARNPSDSLSPLLLTGPNPALVDGETNLSREGGHSAVFASAEPPSVHIHKRTHPHSYASIQQLLTLITHTHTVWYTWLTKTPVYPKIQMLCNILIQAHAHLSRYYKNNQTTTLCLSDCHLEHIISRSISSSR